MTKRHFIKDPVWGNIELFPWEASLLRNFLFNRLHHVIQNSCAYLVYPGLRYSRFVHSLGVMHVASQMFINVVVNSKQEYLDELSKESEFVENLFHNLREKEEVISTVTSRVRCPANYALLLGTVRVAALLHDIGHLPYSHVFEFALERFVINHSNENERFASVKGKAKDSKETTRRLHDELQRIFMPPDREMEPIHEALGHQLITILAKEPPLQSGVGFATLIEGARQLWVEDALPISKSLLSADVDADRIDFVCRDGVFSGLVQRSVDFNRLFDFYELEEFENEGISKGLLGRPSIRASSEAEQVLWQRFLDYKYIAAHHKVHLFDELLERLLFYSICDGAMNSVLEAVVNLTELPSNTLDYQARIIQAKKTIQNQTNDSWVDTQLAAAYETYAPQREKSRLLRRRTVLYEGLSEQRILFKSLFKRDEDYREKFPFNATDRDAGAFDPVATYSLATAVKEHKYQWEAELSEELGTEVVVGDLTSKLRIGIHNKAAANFFGLGALMQFLESKYQTSRPFNVWYYVSSDQAGANYEKEIVRYLRTHITELMRVDI